MQNQIKILNKINSFNKTISVESDKSLSIRAVLLASQAIGISSISNILESEDVMSTIKSIKKHLIALTNLVWYIFRRW